MAKSSSSHRNKRDKKVSSKIGTKKSKSKSDKYRSKKARRDDSLSCSNEDDSRSVSSDSWFSSEVDRRRRRARSRARRDVKGGKKRDRKRSYSGDSSEESPRLRAKKRRASKKVKEYEAKKRGRSREKVRRKARTSSLSSESRSCSTCQGGDISGDEIESKRHRGKAEKRKGSRYRSRSHSLHSHYSESDCQSRERVNGEGNGRRLRSVIVVTEEDNQGGRWLDEEGHKEEITYDHDDYPSSRSNDSNDGGSKRELDDHLASEAIMRAENMKEEEALVSDDGIMMTDSVNENKISAETSSLKDDDLETILRQKALENLRRFRGKPQANKQEDEKQPSGTKGGLVPVESLKEDISEIKRKTRLAVEASGSPVKESICGNEAASAPAKEDVACPTHQDPIAGNSKKASTGPSLDKPNLAARKSMSSSPKTHSTLKQALASLNTPQERLLVTESGVGNTASGTAQTVIQSSNNDGLDISKGSGENRSDLQQDEAKDGSQFEQKTMSVMRGSEMVQVSYKVYIPKKAPALARRQLKR